MSQSSSLSIQVMRLKLSKHKNGRRLMHENMGISGPFKSTMSCELCFLILNASFNIIKRPCIKMTHVTFGYFRNSVSLFGVANYVLKLAVD